MWALGLRDLIISISYLDALMPTRSSALVVAERDAACGWTRAFRLCRTILSNR
jgi:hypothetical protein